MNENTNPIIETKNLNFSYAHHRVIEDVNFRINEGDYLGLIGPNGSGKSTLIKLILGLLKPQSGTIELFGNTPNSNSKKYISYIAQKRIEKDNDLPISVYEVALTGRVAQKGLFRGFNKNDFSAVNNALSQVEMSKFKNYKMSDLSGGMKQRVLIARAIASESKLLILDEPTVGIDTKSQDEFYSLLANLHKNKKITILIVSHDIDVIANEVNVLACINKTMVYHGTPKKFIKGEYVEKMLGKNRKFIIHDH